MFVNLYAKMTKIAMKYLYSCPELKEIKQSYFRFSETYKNITWFRLINQIAPIITPASFMEPFRELLQLTRANGKNLFLGQSLPRAF